MRKATVATLICLAGALAGCSYVPSGSTPGSTVDFVSANADSVLLDFNANVKGELDASREIATQQCGIFHRGAASLESLNVRTPGTIRAAYRCGA